MHYVVLICICLFHYFYIVRTSCFLFSAHECTGPKDISKSINYKPYTASLLTGSGNFSLSGAGSCLEALGAGKPLLVVVNDKLMDNHQLELARQLHMDSHLLYCTCRYVSPHYMYYIYMYV